MKKYLFLLLLFICTVFSVQAQVTYNLAYDSGTETYTVSMRSGNAYTGGLARMSSSTQVAITAPHTTGGFQVTNIVDLQSGGTPLDWGFSRVDAPTENSTKDYFFFSPANAFTYTPFDIAANTQIDLFSFQSGSGCLGALNLVNNNTDPVATSGNFSANNSMVVVGTGTTNLYQGNTSGDISCVNGAIMYCLEYDAPSGVYTVSMESGLAFTGNLARLSPSTQVTLVFPHEMGGFQISDLTDLQAGGTPLDWAYDRLDTPTENTSVDYLFFSPANAFTYTPFDITANTKTPLFSFKLASNCFGNIALFDNNSDTLNSNTQYSPQNNLVIVGGGTENQYAGNSCASVPCSNCTVNCDTDGDGDCDINCDTDGR